MDEFEGVCELLVKVPTQCDEILTKHAPFSVLHVEFKTDLVLGRAEELREKVTCHGPREWGRKTHRFGESCVTFVSLSP